MDADQLTDLLVAVIRSIPPDDESQASITKLCEKVGFDEPAAAVAGPVLAALLDGFGVLRSTDAGPDRLVKAEGPTALLFLRSFAEYLSDRKALLENWSRAGTVDAPYSESDVLAGPQFLYFAERRRIAADAHAPALRHAEVAQIVISQRTRSHGLQYLMMHDRAAHQYQLPGGHRRSDDVTLRQTALRELQEELPGFVFDATRDQLTELGDLTVTQVSRTYGVATAYKMAIFHLRSTRTQLPIGPEGRWVGESVLLATDAAIEGQTLNIVGLRKLDGMLPGGLRSLTASFHLSRRGWLVTVARAKPLEFWGFVIGLLGLLASVVFFVLQ